MSKIEQRIAELEEYIDNCKPSTFSSTKITVNKDEILELINNLKRNVPEEIKTYSKIIANRNAILKDAQDKAEEMIKKANEMTSTLVSEHEIMQQAFKEANAVIDEATRKAGNILDKATAEANEIRSAAISYTDDSLANIQDILSTAIEGVSVKYDGLLKTLEASLEVTNQNRKSLVPDQNPANSAADLYKQEDFGNESVAEPEEYAKEAYSAENAGEMSLEDAYSKGEVNLPYNGSGYEQNGSVEEITDFNLDVSDFK